MTDSGVGFEWVLPYVLDNNHFPDVREDGRILRYRPLWRTERKSAVRLFWNRKANLDMYAGLVYNS